MREHTQSQRSQKFVGRQIVIDEHAVQVVENAGRYVEGGTRRQNYILQHAIEITHRRHGRECMHFDFRGLGERERVENLSSRRRNAQN